MQGTSWRLVRSRAPGILPAPPIPPLLCVSPGSGKEPRPGPLLIQPETLSSSGRPCAGNPARSFSRPGRAVSGKALVREEVGPERAGLQSCWKGSQWVIRVQMTSPGTATPARDNQPQPGIPRAAHGRDARTPRQQSGGGGGRGKAEQGRSHPPWAPLATRQCPFRRSRRGSGSRPSALGLVPMPPEVPSRGIQAPPRPAQTRLLWVSVTALLNVPVPLCSICQLRFRAASLASPLETPPRAMVGA